LIDEDDLMMPGDFKKEKYEVKMGEHTADFDMNDPIFSVTIPVSELKGSRNCNFCKKDLKSKPNHFCEFCGERNCEKCMHKSRPFKNSSGNQKKILRG